MPFDADAYPKLAADVQGRIAEIIEAAVTVEGEGEAPDVVLAKVLTQDPVNLDEARWAASLLSDADKDENDDKRIHAWVVTFAGAEPEKDTGVHDLQTKLTYQVQVFYSHDYGEGGGSEARLRDEIMRVQWALASDPDFTGIGKIGRHYNLHMRVALGRMGESVIHRGRGELVVGLHPLHTG
ncbi:MAG TPA: hypothetical protein VK421_06055 [Pyrinomonadaceae bacterium]|nr:hypothetical protein [Pyrinomonadaceae bacterium]